MFRRHVNGPSQSPGRGRGGARRALGRAGQGRASVEEARRYMAGRELRRGGDGKKEEAEKKDTAACEREGWAERG